MFANILATLLQILTSVPSLIVVAEKAFSGTPGSGAAKKELIMSATENVINAAGLISGEPVNDEHRQVVLGTVSAFTDATVGILNSVDALDKTQEQGHVSIQ